MLFSKPLQQQSGAGLLGFPLTGTPFIPPQPQDAPRELVSTEQPFVWGQGGVRISPEELARRRALADKMGASDYSPIASPWQGVGRVADGLLAGLESKKLNKAAEANTAYGRQVMEALMKGGQGDVAAQAMMDPSLSSDVQGFAKMQWERAHPKPVNNDTAADMELADKVLGAGSGKQLMRNKLDPIVQIPLPGGQMYVGRESGFAAAAAAFQGGGGPASTAAPTTLPPDFDFNEGGPGASQPRAGFR